MKTLRFVGSAILAVLLSVNLTSCGSDDDDSNGGGNGTGITKGKKIVKIVEESENGSYKYKDVQTFEYDSEGRLSKYISILEEKFNPTTSRDTITKDFYWADGAIKVVRNDEHYKETSTLVLVNGLVQSCEGSGNNSYTFQDAFTYNEKNQFVWGEHTSGYSYSQSTTAKWDGDKLVSMSNNGQDEVTRTLAYGTSCSKGYFPFVVTMMEFCNDALYVAHPEIVGMRTNQLPSSITLKSRYETVTSEVAYEFDNEGYLSKVVADDCTYTINWQ